MYNFPDERLVQFSDPVFYLMINGDLKSDNIDALFTGGGQAWPVFYPTLYYDLLPGLDFEGNKTRTCASSRNIFADYLLTPPL